MDPSGLLAPSELGVAYKQAREHGSTGAREHVSRHVRGLTGSDGGRQAGAWEGQGEWVGAGIGAAAGGSRTRSMVHAPAAGELYVHTSIIRARACSR